MEIRKTNNLKFLADSSIVFLCGMPGSGKSTFAAKYLKEFSVIDIDDIYDQVEDLLHLKNRSIWEQRMLANNYYEHLDSRLTFSIRKSLRENAITFVIANVTDKRTRAKFIQRFARRYKNCFAIVLDIKKKTLIKQYENDEYNEGMNELLSNYDSFKDQIDTSSFEEFDIVYILDEIMVNSVIIEVVN